jgi:hypothetical protein
MGRTRATTVDLTCRSTRSRANDEFMETNTVELRKEADFRIEGLDFTTLGEAAGCVERGMKGGLEMQLEEAVPVLDPSGQTDPRCAVTAVGGNAVQGYAVERGRGGFRFIGDVQAATGQEQSARARTRTLVGGLACEVPMS